MVDDHASKLEQAKRREKEAKGRLESARRDYRTASLERFKIECPFTPGDILRERSGSRRWVAAIYGIDRYDSPFLKGVILKKDGTIGELTKEFNCFRWERTIRVGRMDPPECHCPRQLGRASLADGCGDD